MVYMPRYPIEKEMGNNWNNSEVFIVIIKAMTYAPNNCMLK